MTGPEHYLEAERLLSLGVLKDAKIHAILALAAATAISRLGAEQTMPSLDAKAWMEAARTQPVHEKQKRQRAASDYCEPGS